MLIFKGWYIIKQTAFDLGFAKHILACQSDIPFFHKIKSCETIEIIINGFLEMAKECHSVNIFERKQVGESDGGNELMNVSASIGN